MITIWVLDQPSGFAINFKSVARFSFAKIKDLPPLLKKTKTNIGRVALYDLDNLSSTVCISLLKK